MVIALHLEVKHLGLARGGSRDKVIVQQLQDAAADVAQLLLNLQNYRAWARCAFPELCLALQSCKLPVDIICT